MSAFRFWFAASVLGASAIGAACGGEVLSASPSNDGGAGNDGDAGSSCPSFAVETFGAESGFLTFGPDDRVVAVDSQFVYVAGLETEARAGSSAQSTTSGVVNRVSRQHIPAAGIGRLPKGGGPSRPGGGTFPPEAPLPSPSPIAPPAVLIADGLHVLNGGSKTLSGQGFPAEQRGTSYGLSLDSYGGPSNSVPTYSDGIYGHPCPGASLSEDAGVLRAVSRIPPSLDGGSPTERARITSFSADASQERNEFDAQLLMCALQDDALYYLQPNGSSASLRRRSLADDTDVELLANALGIGLTVADQSVFVFAQAKTSLLLELDRRSGAERARLDIEPWSATGGIEVIGNDVFLTTASGIVHAQRDGSCVARVTPLRPSSAGGWAGDETALYFVSEGSLHRIVRK